MRRRRTLEEKRAFGFRLKRRKGEQASLSGNEVTITKLSWMSNRKLALFSGERTHSPVPKIMSFTSDAKMTLFFRVSIRETSSPKLSFSSKMKSAADRFNVPRLF